MPRKPRVYLPGIPCHVIQRGNNRDVCFAAEEDYQAYLEWLGDGADQYECAVHAYVLMTNHVHLLVTPQDRKGVSRPTQAVVRREDVPGARQADSEDQYWQVIQTNELSHDSASSTPTRQR